jgi:hypothetical protein
MTATHVTIKSKQLPEGVFLATSDDVPGLAVECNTREEIVATASMTYRELRRLLVDHGCRYLRDARGGGHEIWLCPGRKPISVPKTLKR